MGQKNALSSQDFWDESENRFVVPPKFGTQWSPLASWYGEGAVDVSVPAPPLSFVRVERDTFSDVSLSVDRYPEYCCGIGAVLFHSIVCAGVKKVKRWDG